MSSLPGRNAPWFTFIFHPRTVADLYRWGGGSVLRAYSSSEDDFVEKALMSPPLVVGEFFVRPSPVRGELIALPSLTDGMLGSRGRRLVIEAALIAARRGTRVVGLGALTAPATRGGLSLVSKVPPQMTVTTGNAYTTTVARDNVHEAVATLNLSRSARVAVVGCTGSVGRALSRLLAEDDMDLTLIGRSAARAERVLPDLAGRARFSGELADVRAADVVLVVTNDPTACLTPEVFRDVSFPIVVVDVAQPPNIPRADYPRFAREGIVVVEGGLVHIPGFVSTQDMDLPPGGSTYACLAETYLVAREGIRDHLVGATTLEHARMVRRIADRRGLWTRPLGLEQATASALRAEAGDSAGSAQ